MKSLLTLFTLLFMVLFPSSSFAEWKKVGDDGSGNNFYIDFERIRKLDGDIYYWVLSDYLKPETDAKLLSSKTYNQVDCELFRYKVLVYVYHKQPMGRDYGETVDAVNINWRYPQPNDFNEYLVELVCNL